MSGSVQENQRQPRSIEKLASGLNSKDRNQKPFAIIELKRPTNAGGDRSIESAHKSDNGIQSAIKGNRAARVAKSHLPRA